MSDLQRDIENAAEGFWAKCVAWAKSFWSGHKWCVIGGAVLFVAGLIFG